MKTFFENVFKHAPRDALVEFSVGGVLPSNRTYKTVNEVLQDPYAYAGRAQTYFGPATRKERVVSTKSNFAGSSVVWVDYDHATRPVHILPESMAIRSGNGWHMYWMLNEHTNRIDRLEAVNKALEYLLMGANEAFDATRILRVPGTINTKGGAQKPCRIVEVHSERVYSMKTLYLSASVTGALQKLILTGDTDKFKGDRSDRDWYIVKHMVDMGFDDFDIELVFRLNACGDKYRDGGDRYLAHTIEKAREAPKASPSSTGILEKGNSYYQKTSRGLNRISTFVLEPTRLLEGKEQDFFMCNIRAEGTTHIWRDVTLPKSAFMGIRSLTKELSKAGWVWLGNDPSVRALQAHLVTQIQDLGMPHAYAVSQLGRHFVEETGLSYYVATNGVVCEDGSIWHEFGNAPVVYVDPKREMPKIKFSFDTPSRKYVEALAQGLRNVNEPEVVWPLIGWFMGTPFKPIFESKNYRFPMLNVSGTRGSGKSTTIQQVFQPLLGFEEARAYDAGTTNFVTLTLLGSSATVPVAFTEFRAGRTLNLNKFVLLAYDTGRSPRGHADQTTTDYPLTAPFCIDGEDMLDDPAALERIISVQPSVTAVREGTKCHAALQQLQTMDLSLLALPYYQYSLTKDINMVIDQAEEDVYGTFVESLPSRIRKNYIVCWTGVLLFADFLKSTYGIDFMPAQGAAVLRRSLEYVYSTKRGRAPVAADAFIEVVVNAAARKVSSFPWSLVGNVLWFQLSPALEYFRGQQARQRQDSLSRSAIRAQLLEMVGEYIEDPEVRVIKGKKVLAYGVNLLQAYSSGLDVPRDFKTHEFVISLGGSNVDA